MFIDTDIPLDNSLVQLLESNQNVMLVQVWRYSCISRTTLKLTNNGSFCIKSMYIGHSAGIAGIIEHLCNIKSVFLLQTCSGSHGIQVEVGRGFPYASQLRVTLCCTPTIYSGWNLTIVALSVHQIGK